MNTKSQPEDKPGVPVRLKLRSEIARVSDTYYEQAKELAHRMQEKLETSQVRNLQNVAYTTDKVSDIFDLVKIQIGRRRWPVELGEDLLDALGKRHAEAERIAQSVDSKDNDLSRQTHLLLCREYIKHLAANFIYMTGVENER